jgi:Lar family restriction alleviation protein
MSGGNVVAFRYRERFHEHCFGTPIPGLPDPKPCPFCGRVEFGGIVQVGEEGDEYGAPIFHVSCDNCGCDGPLAMSQAEAAALWNDRCVAKGERP